MTDQTTIEATLLSQLKSIIEADLPVATTNGVVKMSFNSVVSKNWFDDEMFTQGVKHMKKAVATDHDAAFVRRLTDWRKQWDMRPLENEDLAGRLLVKAIQALAAGEHSERRITALREDTTTAMAPYNTHEFFNDPANQRAVVVGVEKGSAWVAAAEGELVERLKKDLDKRLTRELGKPTGTASNKRFERDGASLSLTFSKNPGNDAFPRDTFDLRVSLNGKPIAILADG